MKICIFGAGSIGGFIGARLAAAGVDVSLVARGPHLAAMREKGLRLIVGDEDFVVHPKCTDDPTELGPQDYVLITLKAPSVPAVVNTIQPLLHDGTVIVPAVNGIPWWYFHKLPGPLAETELSSVDPERKQWLGLGPERVLGCVVWPSAELIEPGVVRHQHGDRLPLGEPDGSRSERALALASVFKEAGLKSAVRPKLRNELWTKLWGNVSFNMLSVLTHATLQAMANDEPVCAIARAMMVEAEAVGTAIGVEFPIDVDKRIDWARDVGDHKPSSLQDLELGRRIEIDVYTGAVQEIGQLVGIATPTIDQVHALVVQRARIAGCY